MAEVTAILDNIGKQTGVLGTVVMTNSGIVVKTTFTPAEAANYAAVVSDFLKRTKTCTDILTPGQGLQVVRVRSFKNELIVCPDETFTLIIVQDSGAV